MTELLSFIIAYNNNNNNKKNASLSYVEVREARRMPNIHCLKLSFVMSRLF